jgi:hypothetical protein
MIDDASFDGSPRQCSVAFLRNLRPEPRFYPTTIAASDERSLPDRSWFHALTRVARYQNAVEPARAHRAKKVDET